MVIPEVKIRNEIPRLIKVSAETLFTNLPGTPGTIASVVSKSNLFTNHGKHKLVKLVGLQWEINTNTTYYEVMRLDLTNDIVMISIRSLIR